MERRKQKAESMQFMTEPDEDHARFPNKGKEGDVTAEKTLVESDSDSDSDREGAEEFKEGVGYNNAPIQKVRQLFSVYLLLTPNSLSQSLCCILIVLIRL